MILLRIQNFFKKHKKTFYYVFFFALVYSFMVDSTFAMDKGELEELKKTLGNWVEWWLKMVSVIVALLTYLATVFLSPSWLNGSLFGLNTYFREIWILVSNVVYFIFAFLLIWIAFMNIIWKNADQYQLKQALPKFIVWVLIVPFSWFLVQLILSISAILTVWALSLPFSTFDNYNSELKKVTIPQNLIIDFSSIAATWGEDWAKAWEGTGEWESKKTIDKQFIKPDWKPIPVTNLTWEGSSITSIFWIISLYSYGILSIDATDDITSEQITQNVTNLFDLVVKIIFDFLFVFIYSILIIALWLVLMVRWIYIWIYTMMSPVFGLMYFFDKKDWWWDWFFAKFNLKEFIALAMVPVYTMLALSFWLLFLYIVWTWMTTAGSTDWVQVTTNKLTIWWDEGLSLIFKWTTGTVSESVWFMKALWIWTLWVIWSLIIKVFGIVVLWWAVMAALRSSDITKTIVQPLHDFWTKVWSIATSAPANVPIFGGQSMKSMGAWAANIQSHIDSAQSKKWLELAEPFIWWNEKDKKYRELGTNAPSDKFAAHRNVESIIWVWDSKDISNSTEAIKWLSRNIEKMMEWGLITRNTEVEEALNKLRNAKWNAQAVREALAIFDSNSTNDNYTVLWWSKKIRDAWQVDEYTWTKWVKSSKINKFESPEIIDWWYKVLGMKVSIENWVVTNDWDYKEFANRFIEQWQFWLLTQTEFNNKLDMMRLTDPEKKKFITEIKKYIKDWKYVQDWSWDWNWLFIEE